MPRVRQGGRHGQLPLLGVLLRAAHPPGLAEHNLQGSERAGQQCLVCSHNSPSDCLGEGVLSLKSRSIGQGAAHQPDKNLAARSTPHPLHTAFVCGAAGPGPGLWQQLGRAYPACHLVCLSACANPLHPSARSHTSLPQPLPPRTMLSSTSSHTTSLLPSFSTMYLFWKHAAARVWRQCYWRGPRCCPGSLAGEWECSQRNPCSLPPRPSIHQQSLLVSDCRLSPCRQLALQPCIHSAAPYLHNAYILIPSPPSPRGLR